MITMHSPDGLASDDEESQRGSPDEDSQDQRQLGPKAATIPSSPQPGLLSRPSIPMQKRRRVTRACDECRRKKIKCDGMMVGSAPLQSA
jgi:Fungal Zn(2)-Cys(6) binuclear cluster domain